MNPRGSWILAIPFGLLLLLLLAAVGWWVAIQIGGSARGAPARFVFTPSCPAGMQAVRDRLDAYGLPVIEDAGNTLVVQLPGLDDDLTHMPAALTAPGVLALTVGGTPLPARVRHVGVQMSLSGQPVTLLTLDVEVPDGPLVVTVDGTPVEVASVNGGEVQILALADESARALRLASDRSVQLRYPLPCAVGATASPVP